MSSSPHLTDEELAQLRKLHDQVNVELGAIAKGDAAKLHRARRHLWKRLEFDERGTPGQRAKLRLTLMAKQQGKCAMCGDPLPSRDSELDRIEAMLGYTEANARLVHHDCHRKAQAAKNYG